MEFTVPAAVETDNNWVSIIYKAHLGDTYFGKKEGSLGLGGFIEVNVRNTCKGEVIGIFSCTCIIKNKHLGKDYMVYTRCHFDRGWGPKAGKMAEY